MNRTTNYVLSESQRQTSRRDQLKLSSMKKSWSMDSLNSMAGGVKTCVCAPTNHPGSFRCRHHRAPSNNNLSGMSAHPSQVFEKVHEDEEEEVEVVKPAKASQGGSIFEKIHEVEVDKPVLEMEMEEEKVVVTKDVHVDEIQKLAI